MTYSYDLREKALSYIENGGTKKSASKIFGVTIRTLDNWIVRNKKGVLAPKRRRSSPSKINSDQLRQYIQEHPDAYLKEIAKQFGSTLQAVFYACRRLKITLKKRSRSTRNGMNKSESNSRMK
jgi:transposase